MSSAPTPPPAASLRNGTTSYSSQALPTSTAPLTVQVSSGMSNRVPWTLVWCSFFLLLLGLFVPHVSASPDGSIPGHKHPNRQGLPRYARDLGAISPSPLVKRHPIADFAGIKLFGQTVTNSLESQLPTQPGHSQTLLAQKISQVTDTICQSGLQNRNLYGPNWTTAPGRKLLGGIFADCVKVFDGVDADLPAFYSTEDLGEHPNGVLFLKFAGIMYCNRLIVPLANDPASLDDICNLAATT